jgi:uncharacterized protein (DUF302 family)
MRHRRAAIVAMSVVVISLVLFGFSGTVTSALQNGATPDPESATSVEGLVTLESAYSVEETIDRLETALEDNGLIVVARIDHSKNADGVGEDLRPTQLLIFGNPEPGTALLLSSQTVGIDLPQKFLAWEDENGQVFLSYNDPAFLTNRHGIADQDAVVQQVSDALAMLAEGATAP